MNLFIFKDGKQEGPYSIEEARRLRAEGRISNSDLAWHEGLAAWTPLSSIPGIALGTTELPPPVPAAVTTAPSGDNSLLIVKRLATAFVLFCLLFVFLFIIFFFGGMMVGGGLAGAHLALQNPGEAQGFQNGYNLGEQAGRNFGLKYGGMIMAWAAGASFIVSAVASLWISFTNLLPWCRRR